MKNVKESLTPKKSTVETIKTIVITAFIFSIIGIVAGYFAAINLQSTARQSVIKDMSIVPSKESKQ